MSTHSLMLPPTSPKDALLACPLFPPRNLVSFNVEFTLSSSCSRCGPPLSLAKMRLSLTLTLSHLTIWCFGQTALFLLAKTAPAYLPTALSVALRPLFPFQQTQYAQVFLLKPGPFCKLFAGLGGTNKSATFHLFFYYLTLVLFLPPCPLLHHFFYLNLSHRNCLLSPPVLSGYNGSPDTLFLPGNDAADELARRGMLLAPFSFPCGLSPFISRIHFSRTGGVPSHLNLLTHRFPRFPPRNMCSLVTLSVFPLVFAATDTT